MIAASVWSLLIPAMEEAEASGLPGWLPAVGARSCKLQCLPKSNPSRLLAGRVFYCLNSRIFPGKVIYKQHHLIEIFYTILFF